MPYPCKLEERFAQPTLAIRSRAAVQDLPRVLREDYGAIAQELGEQGERPPGLPFVAYHNMDIQDLDIEIGFPVTRELPGKNDVQARLTGRGQVMREGLRWKKGGSI